MRKNVLIIGAGGVAGVVAHKCAMNNDILGNIAIASRKKEKCENLIKSILEKDNLKDKTKKLEAFSVDALDVEQTKELIKKTESEIVINVGSAFLNMSVLQACIETGAAYIDTAIHEDPFKTCEQAPWYGNYEWKRKPICEEKGITAILSAGFDPGLVNAYASYAIKDYFDKDTVTDIDIIDINAGSHGKYFATNFDPEINLREFVDTAVTWQNNQWVSHEMFKHKRTDDLPVVGEQNSYLCGHDEIHSLAMNTGVPNIRFWMGFGDHYINVFKVLQNLGLLSINPVKTAEGLEVIPIKVVKAVLPDPTKLAENYTGKTCIGDKVKGKKDGVEKEIFVYNIADHNEAYKEVGSQGISYTAGVPAVAAAILVAKGDWDVKKMVNVEELDHKPFINLLNKIGLPTRIKDEKGDRLLEF